MSFTLPFRFRSVAECQALVDSFEARVRKSSKSGAVVLAIAGPPPQKPETSPKVSAERRKELLAQTAAGRAILRAKDKGKATAKAGSITPARRKELLAATNAGRAILRREGQA